MGVQSVGGAFLPKQDQHLYGNLQVDGTFTTKGAQLSSSIGAPGGYATGAGGRSRRSRRT